MASLLPISIRSTVTDIVTHSKAVRGWLASPNLATIPEMLCKKLHASNNKDAKPKRVRIGDTLGAISGTRTAIRAFALDNGLDWPEVTSGPANRPSGVVKSSDFYADRTAASAFVEVMRVLKGLDESEKVLREGLEAIRAQRDQAYVETAPEADYTRELNRDEVTA